MTLDTAYFWIRLVTMAASVWLMAECARDRHHDTRKDAQLYLLLSGWGLVAAYAMAEQIYVHAPAGLRSPITLVLVLFSIRVVRQR